MLKWIDLDVGGKLTVDDEDVDVTVDNEVEDGITIYTCTCSD